MNTALVTGASKGIGRAITLRLSRMGYSVFLLGRDRGALEAVVSECTPGSPIVGCLPGDLRDPDYMDEAVRRGQALLGHIDVLVNNAGISLKAPVQDADLEAWRSVVDINFNSALHLSNRLLPPMIERRSGAILNISSLSGRHTDAGGAIYAATKFALNGFTGCLYEDVREFGIKVSAIMPGFVDTALTAKIGKNSANMIHPDDVADAVEFVLSSSSTCCPTEIVIRPQQRP